MMGAYLAADHDVSHFGLAVAAVRLVVSRADGQNEVPRVALALPHQEAAVLAFLRQQLLGIPARQVSVEPPGEKIRNRQTCFRWTLLIMSLLLPTVARIHSPLSQHHSPLA